MPADASGINPEDIHAYILGEHGDSEFAALSLANVGGVWFKENSPQIAGKFEEAKQGGYLVMKYKGFTNYAIALATATVIEHIVHDKRKVLPVSTLIDGYCGVKDIASSLGIAEGVVSRS